MAAQVSQYVADIEQSNRATVVLFSEFHLIQLWNASNRMIQSNEMKLISGVYLNGYFQRTHAGYRFQFLKATLRHFQSANY